MIGIYKITNKINGKIYVGQSNDIQRRFLEHTHRNKLQIDMAIQKYGKENFIFEILEECPIEQLNEREMYWIETLNSFKNGYNYRFGGNNGRHSERSKKKMSEAHKGDNSYWYGKRGKETPMYGKHHSEETKKKIKESMKGKNKGEKNYWYGKARGSNPNAKIVYCEELNDIRFSAKDWAEELNICYDSILKCCRGVTKSAGGYHFKFINKEKMYELSSNK